MDAAERVIRVWRGLDSLQAHLLWQTLLDHGIECYLDREAPHLELGMNDVGIWVDLRDKDKAKELIAEFDVEMREVPNSEEMDETAP